MHRFTRASKWLHKMVGLTLVGYCVWMGLSGVLVNHPEWTGEASVPRWLTPPQYRLREWNRGAIVGVAWAPGGGELGWAYGSEGVWETPDGGRGFRRLADGYPAGPRARRTRDVLVVGDGPAAGLWAATEAGLFWRPGAGPGSDAAWRAVPLGDDPEPARAILHTPEDRLVAVSASGAWMAAPAATPPGAVPAFRPAPLPRAPAEAGPPLPPASHPLVEVLFDVHAGRIAGLPGRLVMDVVGIGIAYLGVSAAWLWFAPWRRKRAVRRGRRLRPRSARSKRVYVVLHETHLEIGIWLSPLLALLAGTGFFLRPPPLAMVVGKTVPTAWIPGAPDDPWHDRIRRATLDGEGTALVLETDEGFWRGPADFSGPFRPYAVPAPVHVMGATVLRPTPDGGLLVGSFSGAFRTERDTHRAIDVTTGRPAAADVSRLRPADRMVTGWIVTPSGEQFLTTFRHGIVPLDGARLDGRFSMPEAMRRDHRLSLWNWMFELHNGRIFQDLVGGLSVLVSPVGSLLFLVLTLTGVWDWTVRRSSRRRREAGRVADRADR